MLDSGGGALTRQPFSQFSLLDGEHNSSDGSSSTDIVLAIGLASLGSAVAAVALGSFIVKRERGEARLPWEEKKLKIHSPLTPSDWSRAFDDQTGRLKGGGQKAIGRVRLGGCSNSIRGEVWPFLLGLHDVSSTAAERETEGRKRREKFEDLRHLARVITRKAMQQEEAKAKAEQKEKERREKEKEREKERTRREREEASRKESLEEEGVLVETREESKGDESGQDVFSDAVEVVSAPGLEASTESFVNVSHEDSAETPLLPEGSSQTSESTSQGCTSREQRLGAAGPSSTATGGVESMPLLAAETSDRNTSTSNSSDGEVDSADGEWLSLASSIPTAFKAGAEGGESALENFIVWRRIMRLDAVRMNSQWVPYSTQMEFPDDEANQAVEEAEVKNYEHLSSAQRTHAARLVSILEAYAVMDPEIGYCQGMTDLLSPFVALILDDSDAFWCFVRFMETARHNFRTDEVGIRKQLDLVAKILEICDPGLYRHLSNLGAQDCIFVYRMVIVLLRRELTFSQTVSLWEVLWAEAAAAAFADSAASAASSIGATMSCGRDNPFALAPARTDFFLFVIAAIVVSRRGEVLQCQGLDEVLRLCNSLAGELEVWELIVKARSLVCQFSLLETAEDVQQG